MALQGEGVWRGKVGNQAPKTHPPILALPGVSSSLARGTCRPHLFGRARQEPLEGSVQGASSWSPLDEGRDYPCAGHPAHHCFKYPYLFLNFKTETLMLGKTEGRRRGMTEDEMVGWPHRLNEHESEQTLEDRERQGSLVCCSPGGL